MTDQEFIQSIPNVEKFYAIFCNHTRMPYVECDEETYSDKAFLFTDEEKAKAFVESYQEKKQSLTIVPVEKASAMHYFASLIADGFDMLSFHDEEIHEYPIEQVVTRTLREGVKKPIENPSLQLSMMYFMQGVHTAETDEEKAESRSREEEMMANIARAVYLVPFSKIEGETDEEGNQKVSLMQLKNKEGDVYIPLFTDMDEFLKIRPAEGTSNLLPMGFKQIRSTKLDQLKGFLINPGSIAVQLNAQNITAIDLKFGDQAK